MIITGIWRAETRNDAKHLTIHRRTLTTKNCLIQNVSTVAIENLLILPKLDEFLKCSLLFSFIYSLMFLFLLLVTIFSPNRKKHDYIEKIKAKSTKKIQKVRWVASPGSMHDRYWMLGAGALGRPKGMVRGGRKEEGSGWGTRVYLWRIHVDIWQNQYNIVKLKNKIKKKILAKESNLILISDPSTASI